jgi:hypothetical protein
MDRKGLLAVQTLLVLTAFATGVGADDEPDDVEGANFDRTPVDCIYTNRIKRTKVIDAQTVLFEMNGDTYLTNMLDRACPGLGREKRFMHATYGRLCDIDTITVLEQWGSSLSQGFTCQLGPFYPITELEAEELLAGPEVAAERAEVEIKEVELPPEETEAAPANEAAPATGAGEGQ